MSVHRWDGVIDGHRVDRETGETIYRARLQSLDGYQRPVYVWLDERGPQVANARPGLRFRWWVGLGVDRTA